MCFIDVNAAVDVKDDSPLEWPISHLAQRKSSTNLEPQIGYEPFEHPGSRDFIIPELPTGSRLTIDVLSTWGDRHYLGLNGIELFTSDGLPPKIARVSIYHLLIFSVDPSSSTSNYLVSCRFGLSLQTLIFFQNTMEILVL